MKKPDLSVIVPVYNAAATLDMVLGSLVDDQFGGPDAPEWEIVAVDDGSTDGSLPLLRQWEARYPDNIRVLTGANGGVSRARNRGLDAARGEWIAFVDADDYLLPGAYSRVLASAGDVDTVRFGCFAAAPGMAVDAAVSGDGAMERMTGAELMERTRAFTVAGSECSACIGIVRRRFIVDHGIVFPPGLPIGEDCIFTMSIMLAGARVGMLSDRLYCYVQNPDSAMQSRSGAHLRRMAAGRMAFARELMALLRCHPDLEGTASGAGIAVRARNSVSEAMADEIAVGMSLGSIWERMVQSRHMGIKLGPGRPRFYNRSVSYSVGAMLRRWIAAYPMAMVAAIIPQQK